MNYKNLSEEDLENLITTGTTDPKVYIKLADIYGSQAKQLRVSSKVSNTDSEEFLGLIAQANTLYWKAVVLTRYPDLESEENVKKLLFNGVSHDSVLNLLLDTMSACRSEEIEVDRTNAITRIANKIIKNNMVSLSIS